ncbi:MAG: DUF2797 domain-containing protein [Leptospiraceae bacterium]|nr:DUF2797 domain-containing protein [Leptospiraceae bacterium]
MLSHKGTSPVEYFFEVVNYQSIQKKKASGEIESNLEIKPLLGKKLRLTTTGEIRCLDCGDITKKSFNQGSCFKCFMNLASNDMCILKPETCHYHLGTCREPDWGQANCFKKHRVYLANTSGLKVGITKEDPVSKRWVDQGARKALVIFEVPSRLEAGIIEIEFAKFISDKTSWQKMVSSDPEEVSLIEKKAELLKLINSEKLQKAKPLEEAEVIIEYPILKYPKKKTALKIDPIKPVESILQGIKGQYMLWEDGVTNIRAYAGYHVKLEMI